MTILKSCKKSFTINIANWISMGSLCTCSIWNYNNKLTPLYYSIISKDIFQQQIHLRGITNRFLNNPHCYWKVLCLHLGVVGVFYLLGCCKVQIGSPLTLLPVLWMSQINKTPTSYISPENQLNPTSGYKVHTTQYDLYQAQWKLNGKNGLRAQQAQMIITYNKVQFCKLERIKLVKLMCT
jgi:hypothetical protein